MKAIVINQYGPPEVLQIMEVEKPIPNDDEILVKIHATTVNRTDTGFRDPQYLLVRLFSGWFTPKIKILGTEFSGVVEATGSKVESYKIGDAVFGLRTFKFGTHAEYVCVKANGSMALKPSNMSHEEAAAVCDGMMLAYNYIKRINFKTHPDILINGASGSIGSAAVQLAKYYGGNITAVCNTKNLELIRSLGAQTVIDYTQEDFTQCGKQFDVVLDAVGKSSFSKCKPILKPKGIYYSSELGEKSENIFLSLLSPFYGGKKVKFPIPTDSKEDIALFKNIIETGNYKAIIDKYYALTDIVEATKYVETGEKTGNVVIRMVS